MKYTLKKIKADKSVIIGAPKFDGSLTINGKRYEYGIEYELKNDEINKELFTEVKDNKNE